MKNLKYLALGTVLLVTQTALFAEDAPLGSAKEAAQWAYIQNYFSSCMTTHDSLGKFLDKNALNLAFLSVLPISVLGALGTHKIGVLLLDNLYKGPYRPSKYFYLCLFCVFMGWISGTVGGLLTNNLAISMGKSLENENVCCYTLLINFLQNWDKHKDQTPTVLQPLFEDLATNVAKINRELARKIIQSIFATSSIALSMD
jgi:hypothetical protein